jgi:hypothetical protein
MLMRILRFEIGSFNPTIKWGSDEESIRYFKNKAIQKLIGGK